jgi:hypothetical protein
MAQSIFSIANIPDHKQSKQSTSRKQDQNAAAHS